MNANYVPIAVFISAFIVSSTAGIASFLRSGKEITKLSLITAGLNSGLLGLAIALLWYQKFQDNIYMLMGICVISGLTGAAGFDAILTAIQRGGLKIDITNQSKDGNSSMGFGMREDEKHEDINATKK